MRCLLQSVSLLLNHLIWFSPTDNASLSMRICFHFVLKWKQGTGKLIWIILVKIYFSSIKSNKIFSSINSMMILRASCRGATRENPVMLNPICLTNFSFCKFWNIWGQCLLSIWVTIFLQKKELAKSLNIILHLFTSGEDRSIPHLEWGADT